MKPVDKQVLEGDSITIEEVKEFIVDCGKVDLINLISVDLHFLQALICSLID